jgi:hypothetical protein
MKQAIITVFLLVTGITAYAQSKSPAAPKFVWDQPDERVFTPFNDTVKAVLLISDFDASGSKEKNDLSSVNGFVVRERYRYNNGHVVDGLRNSKLTGYLTLDKKPVSADLVVWDARELE